MGREHVTLHVHSIDDEIKRGGCTINILVSVYEFL